MWFGVYETLTILATSAIAGIVGYTLDGIMWGVVAFCVIALSQFVGLFAPEIMISDDWTSRAWAVVILGVVALIIDPVMNWFKAEASSQHEPAIHGGGGMEDM